MEQKRGSIASWTALVTFLAIITLTHTASHFVVYGTGIQGFFEAGVSGFAIGPLNTENIKNNEDISPISRIFLIIEWAFLVFLGTAVIIARRMSVKEEVISMSALQKRDKSKTDIDSLHEILKEKKHLRISTIARVFKISKEKALEWCQILEDANLAAISYPRMGEPEVIITS